MIRPIQTETADVRWSWRHLYPAVPVLEVVLAAAGAVPNRIVASTEVGAAAAVAADSTVLAVVVVSCVACNGMVMVAAASHESMMSTRVGVSSLVWG